MPPKKQPTAKTSKQVRALEQRVNKVEALERRMSAMALTPKKQKAKKTPNLGRAAALGTTRVANTEFLYDVKIPAKASSVGLAIPFTFNGTSIIPAAVLAKIAGIYETYKVHRLAFSFHSATSSSKSGIVVLGIDSDGSTDRPTAAATVFKYGVHTENQVYQNSKRITVPTSVLSPSLVRRTAGTADRDDQPITLMMFATMELVQVETTIGYLEIHYDVSFSGIKA